jgi:hypothetical protein
MTNTPSGHPPAEFKVCYRNKEFTVGILKSDIEVHNMPRYTTYQIFINGNEAGCYHKMKKSDLRSGYYYSYEEINKRHRQEVAAIIYAANSLLKQQAKPKKEKKDGYTEYSYFK